MIQEYPLGLTSTRIDGGNIATGTIISDSLAAGCITAEKVDAGAITAEKLAVGPQYQFRPSMGGQPMRANADGSLSLPTSGRNSIDPRWIMDASRSYPASTYMKTYAATFYYTSSSNRAGIIFNIAQGSAFSASGSTGLMVWMSDTNLTIYRVAGVAQWTAIATYTVTRGSVDRLLVQFYGTQATPRMRVYLNGVEAGAGVFTDAFLGTSGGAQGGCAGFLLQDSTICVSEIVMGNQTVTLEDGRVKAQHIDAVSVGASQVIVSSIVKGINEGTTTIDGGKISANQAFFDNVSVGNLTAFSAAIAGKLDAKVIAANSLSADQIYGGTISASTFQTPNYTYGTWDANGAYTRGALVPAGAKIAATTFPACNVWGASQNVQADFGGTVMVCGFPLDRALAVPLTAIHYPRLDQASATDKVFYRGNNNPTVRGGVPLASCLSVSCVASSIEAGVFQKAFWVYTITPTSYDNATDNLDALRYMRVRLYLAPTSSAPFADFSVPLSDRLYDSEAGLAKGVIRGSFSWAWRSNTAQMPGLNNADTKETNGVYSGYMRCTLYNAYGASADVDFSPNTTAGAACTVTSITGSGASSGSGSGGSNDGGYTGCLPAGALINTSCGLVPIELLPEGAMIAAFDDNTLTPVWSELTGMIVYDDRQLYRITTDRKTLICSHDHRIARAVDCVRADYPPARDLEPGDILYVSDDAQCLDTAVVTAVEPLDRYERVYHLQLKTGHVFIGDGFAAHNMKIMTRYS